MQTKMNQEEYIKYCPRCGSRLTNKESFDKFIISWSCERGHEWYMDTVNLSAAEVSQPLNVEIDIKDPALIIKSWITEPALRKCLHPQAAEAFRAIVRKMDDPEFGKRNVEGYQYNFCMSCGTKVTPIPPDDWDNPFVCEKEHHQSMRGGRFYRYVKDENDSSKGLSVEIKWELAPSNGYKWLEAISKPTRSGFFMQSLKPSTSVPKQVVKVLPQLKKLFLN